MGPKFKGAPLLDAEKNIAQISLPVGPQSKFESNNFVAVSSLKRDQLVQT